MEIADFDDVFPHIGGFGLYQRIIFAIICYFNILLCFLYFGQIFLTLTPPHWCADPPGLREGISEVLNVTFSDHEWKKLTIPARPEHRFEFSTCARYDIDVHQVREGTLANSSWEVTSCSHGWSYNYSLYYPTITSQMNWVCNEDWKPPFAQTCFFIGSMIGVPVLGFLADRFGRIPAILVSNLIGGVFGIASSFCTNFVVFCVLRFCVGFSFDSSFFIIYILGLEYVSSSYRSIVANVPILVFLTASMCSLPWIAVAIHDWTLLGVALHTPFFFVAFLPWMLPESARWLLSKGKEARATRIVAKASQINGKALNDEFLAAFKNFASKTGANSSVHVSILDLLKSPVLRKRFLALVVMYIAIFLAYDGHARQSENIGTDVFTSFTLLGAVELPGDLLTLFCVEWIGRRHTTVWGLILSGLAAMAVIFVDKRQTNALMTLAVIGRFMITVAINVGNQYVVEVLPTVGRAQGTAAIRTLGYGMAFLSPYFVYLSKYGHWLPYLILGVISTTGGLTSLLLPETLGEKLPDTLQDGEQFFANQPCCYNPFQRNKYKEDEDGERSEERNTLFLEMKEGGIP